MTQDTILKVPYDEYKKKTIIRLVICIAAALAVIAVNLTLYFVVTDGTKNLFKVLNIVLDTACCWVILYYALNVLLVRKRLLKIYQNARDLPSDVRGTVKGLYSEQKVYKFDCFTVELETDDGVRKVFVIKGSFEHLLKEGAKVYFALADNVAIGVEVEDEA